MNYFRKKGFILSATFAITFSFMLSNCSNAKTGKFPFSQFVEPKPVSVSKTFEERFKYPPPIEYLDDPNSFDKNSKNALASIQNNLEQRNYFFGVFIDHCRFRRLYGACRRTYILQPGHHELQVGNDDVASEPLTFDLQAGETKFFGFSSLPQGKISKFFLGPTHIKLQEL